LQEPVTTPTPTAQPPEVDPLLEPEEDLHHNYDDDEEDRYNEDEDDDDDDEEEDKVLLSAGLLETSLVVWPNPVVACHLSFSCFSQVVGLQRGLCDGVVLTWCYCLT